MTVASTLQNVRYTGDGSNVSFPIPFSFLDNEHIKVYLLLDGELTSTLLTLNTHYTLSGAGSGAGGTLTMATAPANAATLTILRKLPITQNTNLKTQGRYSAETFEATVDKLTMIAQQLDGALAQAIQSDPGIDASDGWAAFVELRDQAAASATSAGASELAAETAQTAAETAQTAAEAAADRLQVHTYSATGSLGQTLVTHNLGVDTAVPGRVMVIIDGAVRRTDSYTLTSSNSLTLSEALDGGELIEVRAGVLASITPANGDMTKAVYDTDDDGVVDAAEKVIGVDVATSNQYYGKNATGDVGFHTLPAVASGDMTKAVYDTDNDGIVDAAEAVAGAATAGNSKYYGTDASGAPGFYAVPTPGGTGDMTKAVYDTDNDGIVDNAVKVNGIDAAAVNTYYGKDASGTRGFHALPTSMTPTAHKASHASGGTDALTPADIGAAVASDMTTALAAKEAITKSQVVVSASSGTLTKNATNIITYSGAGTYTMPSLSDGEWIRILPRTTGHTINYDGTRSFWLADGTTATSFTVASGELSGLRLEAFQTSYVGGAR